MNQSSQSNKSLRTVVKTNYKYSEITAKIIGCSMEVHKILGNGFQEVIYQRALAKILKIDFTDKEITPWGGITFM